MPNVPAEARVYVHPIAERTAPAPVFTTARHDTAP